MSDQSDILDRRITVCDSCLTAACWLYIFPCQEFKSAGTKELTVRELRKMNRENSDYWFRDVNTGATDYNASAEVEELMPL